MENLFCKKNDIRSINEPEVKNMSLRNDRLKKVIEELENECRDLEVQSENACKKMESAKIQKIFQESSALKIIDNDRLNKIFEKSALMSEITSLATEDADFKDKIMTFSRQNEEVSLVDQ